MTKTTNNDKTPFIKQPSPFRADPFNNRSGGGGKKIQTIANVAKKGKSVNVAKFKGGSGGDR